MSTVLLTVLLVLDCNSVTTVRHRNCIWCRINRDREAHEDMEGQEDMEFDELLDVDVADWLANMSPDSPVYENSWYSPLTNCLGCG